MSWAAPADDLDRRARAPSSGPSPTNANVSFSSNPLYASGPGAHASPNHSGRTRPSGRGDGGGRSGRTSSSGHWALCALVVTLGAQCAWLHNKVTHLETALARNAGGGWESSPGSALAGHELTPTEVTSLRRLLLSDAVRHGSEGTDGGDGPGEGGWSTGGGWGGWGFGAGDAGAASRGRHLLSTTLGADALSHTGADGNTPAELVSTNSGVDIKSATAKNIRLMPAGSTAATFAAGVGCGEPAHRVSRGGSRTRLGVASVPERGGITAPA